LGRHRQPLIEGNTIVMTAEQLRPADRDEPSGDLAVGTADVVSMRGLVIAAGLCWSVLFVVLGLLYRLQFYADGSIFSYAVAVEDAWAFHWHNISGRLFVYLFCHVPAEIYVDSRADSKQAKLIEMLKRPDGATIDEIVKKFEWQPHTVRGAIAGALKKKLGLDVQSAKVEGRGRVYRIAA
jgi:hypothetical protein